MRDRIEAPIGASKNKKGNTMTFNNTIIHGDCVHALAQLDTASVDFVLTDPPYLSITAPATVARHQRH